METIIECLERSFQNCSLNHNNQSDTNRPLVVGVESSSSSDDADATQEQNHIHHHLHHDNQRSGFDDRTLELNSHVSLPCNWEQCLDLKTGEIYYINWRSGMRAKVDPRLTLDYYNGDCYSDDYDVEDEYDQSLYDSDQESSSEYSISSSSREQQQQHYNNLENERNNVLVVAGCKSCLMYLMVPKNVQGCPKCYGHLLHFDKDRSRNGSPA